MSYNNPDPRWEIFGYTEYEFYVNKLVVKGLFNKLVPVEVTDAFLLAEHIMAQAYYYYPLYDEAFSKLLRILEMAVKLRCGQLGIQLHLTTNNKGKEKEHARLIEELQLAEPAKEVKERLDAFRRSRNVMMHPKTNSFSGPMSHGAIVAGVNLLNELFLPEAMFLKAKAELASVENLTAEFKEGPFILEIGNKTGLIKGIELQNVFLVGQDWTYLFAFLPVTINISADIKNDIYPSVLVYLCSGLEISQGVFSATESRTRQSIKVYPTNNPEHSAAYRQSVNEKQHMTVFDKTNVEMHLSAKIGEVENEFLYQNLWRI